MSMKLGIMQPYFFPYIGYWQLMNAVDTYVIYDDVNYIKNGWINRNKILVNGKPTYFNLQLLEASPNKRINEIKINSNPLFKNKNIKKIELSYKKAPFFNETFPLIKEILEYDDNNLALYLGNQIIKIANYLDMKTNFIFSSNLEKDNNLKNKDKVIDICKVLKANEYYNAIGGKSLYNKKEFKEKGIKLSFLKTQQIEYKQFSDKFVDNLSIIDILMFNSKNDSIELLQKYEME